MLVMTQLVKAGSGMVQKINLIHIHKKMQKLKKRITLISVCVCLCLKPVFSSDAGTTGLNFLKIGVGAKALGMGGAFSAIADDASAVYWNPAGLSQLRYRQVSFMHTEWFKNIDYDFLSYIHPIKVSDTLGLSLYSLRTGDIASYDNYGDALGDNLKASDLAFAISYGKTFRGIDLGASLKYIQSSLADESANAFALDLGMLYELKIRNIQDGKLYKNLFSNKLKLSLVAQNIGTKVKFIKEEDPLPVNYRLGFGYKLLYDSIDLSLDLNLPNDNDFFANAGINYKIVDWFSLRLGNRFASIKDKYDIQPGLMGGVGIGNEYISIDYAFAPYNELGDTHRIGINFKFGRAYVENLVNSKINKHMKLAKKYYFRKDYIQAYSEFKNVSVIDPTNTEANQYLKEIRLKYEEINVNSYLNLVREYKRKDELIEAKDLLDKIMELFPENPDAKKLLDEIQKALKQRENERISSMFEQGTDYFKQKRYQDAITMWENILFINPNYEQVKEKIELAKQELHKIEQQKKEQVRELNRKKAIEDFNKGMKYYENKKWQQAKEMFDEVVKLDPGHQNVQKYLTETNKVLAKEYLEKGMQFYNDKYLEEAAKIWEKALILDPNNNEIKSNLDKVRSEYEANKQNQAAEYNRKGLKEYSIGNLDKAVELWEKALELDPDNGKIKNSLNRAKEELKKKK